MTNPLFEPGDDWRLNACLNYGADSWFAYADGYRRAAELVTDYVRGRHTDQDILIFPVLFLWRHHLEVKLKAIARKAARLLGEDWAPTADHDLSQLFAPACLLLERCFDQFGQKLPRADLARVRTALARFKTIDARAMTFRYPEDLLNTKHLEGVTHINFDVVANHMTQLSDVLENMESALYAFEEWQSDADSAYW